MNIYYRDNSNELGKYTVGGVDSHNEAIEAVADELERLKMYAWPILAVIDGGKQ